MKYNEWRDELKNNLLSVTDSERKRVLDYYAEAYADRREAGFTESEIIDDFGAPYDAAQRILCETEDGYEDVRMSKKDKRKENIRVHQQSERKERQTRYYEEDDDDDEDDYCPDDDFIEPALDDEDYYEQPKTKSNSKVKNSSGGGNKSSDYTWLFVLLCVVFAGPLFGLIMSMVGITIGLCVSPFALLIGGIATTGAGIGALFKDLVSGLTTIGIGVVIIGVSIILIPLMIKLVKLMWKLFKQFFSWVKSLFSGKEHSK